MSWYQLLALVTAGPLGITCLLRAIVICTPSGKQLKGGFGLSHGFALCASIAVLLAVFLGVR